MADPIHSVSLLLAASMVNTGFAVFMKRIRNWDFEHIWLVWAMLALVLLPLMLSLATIPSLFSVYGNCIPVVLKLMAIGLSWGLSQIFLGLAVATVGIGVSFAVILGISALIGGLIPWAGQSGQGLPTTAGLAAALGLLLMMVGVAVCAQAGWQRDRCESAGTNLAARGLLYCLLAGAGSGLMNLALVYGGPVISAAAARGANALWAPNAAWLPFLWAGAVPNIAYCLWRLYKNHSLDRHATGRARTNWSLFYALFYALMMSACWLGSAVLYTLGARQMGPWGPAFAWPIYMSLIVVTGNGAGAIMGEWKSSSAPLRQMAQGVGLLILAVFLLAGGKPL